jgi:ribose/xylose/arabinose/galactoside ABC-type transport system permease subunit
VWFAPLLATAATLVVGFIVFKAFGKDPIAAFDAFFIQPVATRYGVAELLLKATPLMLIATGLAIGYRANVWNIGAEGQLTLGAIAGGGVALAVGDAEWPSALLLTMMFAAGALAGMLWAAIPAWLRTRFNANEILTSLMLVYVATLLLSWLVHGPWRDPEGYNFPQSRLFTDSALLPNLVAETRLNAGILIALAIVAIAWVFVRRHIVGFEMRVAGTRTGGGELRGHRREAQRLARHARGRRVRRHRGCRRSGGADRTVAAVHVARLRLRRDHRRVRRPAASARHRVRQHPDVAPLPRRRIGADEPRAAVGGDWPIPGDAAVFPAGSRCIREFPRAHRAARGGDVTPRRSSRA